MNNDKDILKMYDVVFEDIVKTYIEDFGYNYENEKLEITEEEKKNVIKEIAHDLIYDAEYLWETIYEHIYYRLEDYIVENEEEEDNE